MLFKTAFSVILLLALQNDNARSAKISLAQLNNLLNYARSALQRSPTNEHQPHLNYSEQVDTVATAIAKHFYNDIIHTTLVQTEEGPSPYRYDIVTERQKVDFMMLLDSSASLGSDDFERATDVLVNWVNILDEEDFNTDKLRVSLLTFSEPDQVYHEIAFTASQNKTEIKNDIQDTHYHNGSSTSTEVALWWADAIFKTRSRNDATKVLLLLTDGWSNNPLALPFGVLFPSAKLRKQGVIIFVAGIGDQINHNELVAIANKPSENHFFEVTDYNMMMDVMLKVKTLQKPTML